MPSYPLPIGAATLPDGSAGNLPCGIVRVKSSAAAPSPHFLQAVADAAQDERLMWQIRAPVDFASGPVLKVPFKMAAAATGDVIVAVRVAAVTPTDAADVDAKAFGTVNTSAATAVPATVGHLGEISVTLTNNDGIAAGDWAVIELSRDADNAGDTAAGDMEILDCDLQYTGA